MENFFYNYINKLIKNTPSVRVEWRNDSSEIVFKKKNDIGFDIVVRDYKNSFYLETEPGYHFHFEKGKDQEKALSNAMGMVRDLLSPNMRIKEISSGGQPFKWLVESYVDNQWKLEAQMGLMVWNFFGRKTEKIYSNDILGPRKLDKE